MKRNMGFIVILVITLYLLLTNQTIISLNVLETSKLFILKILPTMLPLFVISKLLINYNLPYYIGMLFNNNIYAYIFIMGIINGCPGNMILIKDLLKNGNINLNEANKYVTCSFFCNPLFLYTMLSSYFNLKITLLIILAHYGANLVIYLAKPIKNINITKTRGQSFNIVFMNAIKEAGPIILNIYITIIIFGIIIALLQDKLKCFIGLLELSQGLNYLNQINITLIYKEILALIYISFGGMSIIIQSLNILSETKINSMNFIKARYLQVIISIIIFLIAHILIT